MSLRCDECLIAQVSSAALLYIVSCWHGLFLRLLWACVYAWLRPHVSHLDGTVNDRLARMLAMSQLLASGHVALHM